MFRNKKACFIVFIFICACLFMGCIQNSGEPTKSKQKDNTSLEEIDIINQVGGEDPSDLVNEDGGFIYLGEKTEEFEKTNYKVKSYAIVYGSPYFYKYYKYFYLGDKLARVHVYYHEEGCRLDYKYTEFVDHICQKKTLINNSPIKTILTYNKDGLVESITHYKYVVEDTDIPEITQRKLNYTYYNDSALKSKIEESIDDDNDNTYYSGSYYYPNGDRAMWFSVESTGEIVRNVDFSFYYESGSCKYECRQDNGSYRLNYWEDGKSNSESASSKEIYTLEQALAKLLELQALFE